MHMKDNGLEKQRGSIILILPLCFLRIFYQPHLECPQSLQVKQPS